MPLNGLPRKIGVGIIAFAAFGGAYAAWRDAFINVVRASNPTIAYAMRSDDAATFAAMIDRRIADGKNDPLSAREVQIGRRAVMHSPINRGTVRILGVDAAVRGDAAADRIMAVADQLSKRDAGTQLWMIERAVQRNDVTAAITHYHYALTVHPRLEPVLFPILTNAISEEPIRAALRPYIRRQVRWVSPMLFHAIVHGDPRNVLRLLSPVANDIHSNAMDGVNARLISNLAEAGEVSSARDYALRATRGIDATALTRLAASPTTTDGRLGNLAWSIDSTSGIIASTNEDDGFDVQIDPLANGPALSRILPVAGGRQYRFTMRVTPGQRQSEAAWRWRLSCVPGNDQTPFWQQEMSAGGEAGTFERDVTVPGNCRGIRFALSARGGDGQDTASVSFGQLSFR